MIRILSSVENYHSHKKLINFLRNVLQKRKLTVDTNQLNPLYEFVFTYSENHMIKTRYNNNKFHTKNIYIIYS